MGLTSETGQASGLNAGAGGDGLRGGDGVNEACGLCFFGAVPVVFAVGQKGDDFVVCLAGLADVAAGHGLGVFVQGVSHVAHVVAVARCDAPRGMDHEQRVFGHFYRVTGHCDQAGDGIGGGFDADGDVCGVALDGVVDGDAIGHAAAIAVDADGDQIGINGGNVFDELLGGNGFVPPAFADVAEDVNLGGSRRIIGGGFGSYGVPGLGHVGSLLSDARRLQTCLCQL